MAKKTTKSKSTQQTRSASEFLQVFDLAANTVQSKFQALSKENPVAAIKFVSTFGEVSDKATAIVEKMTVPEVENPEAVEMQKKEIETLSQKLNNLKAEEAKEIEEVRAKYRDRFKEFKEQIEEAEKQIEALQKTQREAVAAIEAQLEKLAAENELDKAMLVSIKSGVFGGPQVKVAKATSSISSSGKAGRKGQAVQISKDSEVLSFPSANKARAHVYHLLNGEEPKHGANKANCLNYLANQGWTVTEIDS